MHLVNVFSFLYITNTKTKENENRIEKLLLVRFLLLHVFRLIDEKLSILCGPHCNILGYAQDY